MSIEELNRQIEETREDVAVFRKLTDDEDLSPVARGIAFLGFTVASGRLDNLENKKEALIVASN